MNHIIRRTAITVAAFLTAIFAVALGVGPAMAATAGNPQSGQSVTATATIGSTITLTVSQASFSFGSTTGPAAQVLGSDTGSPQIDLNVTTNDTSGYSGDVEAADLGNGHGGTIANSNLEVGTALGSGPYDNGTTFKDPEAFVPEFSSNSMSAPTGDIYHQAWALAVPANQAAGTYTTGIDYLVTAN